MPRAGPGPSSLAFSLFVDELGANWTWSPTGEYFATEGASVLLFDARGDTLIRTDVFPLTLTLGLAPLQLRRQLFFVPGWQRDRSPGGNYLSFWLSARPDYDTLALFVARVQGTEVSPLAAVLPTVQGKNLNYEWQPIAK